MSRPTLVTGAAGFAGSHVLDLLAPQGADVVAWHRPGGSPPSTERSVRWQAVDVLDRLSVRQAIQEIQPRAVYHCAGAAHVGQAWNATTTTLATNVLGTHHLIEALRDFTPDAHVLNTSSALVYTPSAAPLDEQHPLVPTSPYGLSKLAQELLGGGNANGPFVHIARPFNHFGPRQNPSFAGSGFARTIALIEAGRMRPEIQVGNLEPLRDLTDVRDTVRAYQLILERGTPGRPYNVCSGRPIKVGHLLDMMLRRAHVSIRVVVDPERYRPNDSPIVQGNPARIREELGWTPKIPVEQTIEDLLAFWRERTPAA
jgi:GDP-4-dehydro-6-deoxy-D-mannose reductase